MKDEAQAELISRTLSEGYPSHDYPITLREAARIGLRAKSLDSELNEPLLELNSLYSEMGQKAVTDYDQSNYHSHEIVNILEGRGVQVFFKALGGGSEVNEFSGNLRKANNVGVKLGDWIRNDFLPVAPTQ